MNLNKIRKVKMKKVRHVVMFRLKEYANGCTKKENAVKIKQLLEELKTVIPQIKSYEIGINVLDSPRAADVSIVSAFDNLDDLDMYKVHPEHVKAADFIMQVRTESWSVDYFI